MSEERAPYNTGHHSAILEVQRPLHTRNLDELERELTQLERMLTPLLNQVRQMLGKEPKE